ncbi:resuscitation-promoting factor [Cellulosimicrobium marinum]|uniref:resuscitation-promoting factor n=1 Tax=Cellulosimicrobium marinum TaxID=1638992 RepID=UPI001E28FF89|nr:resuscitation-promoting factor [Cellulosimicrobium marinum]MCB7137004.1 transglycosylase family protein [Cellulosimicrobium marinum]
MPGNHDDWTRVNNPFHRTADAAGAPESADTTQPLDLSDPTAAQGDTSPAATTARRRRWPLVAGATAVVLLATGAVAYGNARKTVELDVDGKTVSVTTFAGSVAGLLEEQGVSVGERDLVVPDADAALRGGSDVVVRYGREVPVQVDGEQSSVWLTALDADEALTTLASRGSDVRLVASRSGERASLPIRLDADGPVAVVADGETQVAPDGSIGIDAILDQQGVELGDLDRVHVEKLDDASQTEGGASEDAQATDTEATDTEAVETEATGPALAEAGVSLVVQRVKVEEVAKEKAVDFTTVTKEDADRYEDLAPVVQQEGKKGVHTTVYRVTTVDGEEESRELVSKGVTEPAVDEVVVKGTKERPAPEPEPAPAPSSSSSSSSGGSSSSGSSSSGSSSSGSQGSAPAGVWAQLAQCESGGNPATNTGNGYYGLYQFSLPTWQAMGGSGLPSEASAAEQTQRAQALQAQSGWGQWPACARKLGLL